MSAMYMGRVSVTAARDVAAEITGARVLITGLTSADGVDIARSFADLKARLIVHTHELSPDIIEVVALLSQEAAEIKLHTHDINSANTAAIFAQTSAQAFGGLDAAINISAISRAEMAAIRTDADLHDLITRKLAPLAQLTRVVANRMSVILSEGLVLNIVKMPHPESAREAAVATYVRTALAAMTVKEANAWADKGIRINAIGPRAMEDRAGAYVTNESEIADLATHLVSRRGRSLSGHVFDADTLVD